MEAGAALFYAGCNKQVFSPIPRKKNGGLVVFEKNATLIPKNDFTDPKARLL